MADLSDDSGEVIKRLIAEWFRRRMGELERAAKEGLSSKLGLGDCVKLMRKWSQNCPEDPYTLIGEKIGGKDLSKAKRALRDAGVDFKVAHALNKEFLCVHQSDLRDAALAIERAGVVMKDVLDRAVRETHCESRAEAIDLVQRLRSRPGAAFDAEVGENADGPCVIVRVAPEREPELVAAIAEWERDLGRDPATKAALEQMEKAGRPSKRVSNLDAHKASVPLADQARGDVEWRDLPVMQWVMNRAREVGIDEKTLAELSLGKNGEAWDAVMAAEAAKERGRGEPSQDRAQQAAKSEQPKSQGKDGQESARAARSGVSEGPSPAAQQETPQASQADRSAVNQHTASNQGPKHMAPDKERAPQSQGRSEGKPQQNTQRETPAQDAAGGHTGQEAPARADAQGAAQAPTPQTAPRQEAMRTHEVPVGFDRTVDALKEAAKENYTRIPRSEPRSVYRQAPATEKQIASLAAAVREGSVSIEEFNTLTADGTTLPDRGTMTDLLKEVDRGERTDTGFRGAEPERESVDDMVSRAEGAAAAENAQRANAAPSRERSAEGPSKGER